MFDNLAVIEKALVSLGIGTIAAIACLAGLGLGWFVPLLMDGRRLRERQREQEHQRRVEEEDGLPSHYWPQPPFEPGKSNTGGLPCNCVLHPVNDDDDTKTYPVGGPGGAL